MYIVEKKDGRTIVHDGEGKVLFSSPDQGYIVHRAGGDINVDRVADMNDFKLLIALANAVKLG